MSGRLKPNTYIDKQDGINVCWECKCQIGESDGFCLGCALYESEAENEALRELLSESPDNVYWEEKRNSLLAQE